MLLVNYLEKKLIIYYDFRLCRDLVAARLNEDVLAKWLFPPELRSLFQGEVSIKMKAVLTSFLTLGSVSPAVAASFKNRLSPPVKGYKDPDLEREYNHHIDRVKKGFNGANQI